MTPSTLLRLTLLVAALTLYGANRSAWAQTVEAVQSSAAAGDERAAPPSIGQRNRPTSPALARPQSEVSGASSASPFGYRLFLGGFQGGRENGVNPDYVVSPGDRITVRAWGATTFSGTLVVDSQGNVFMPEIGPIALGGVRNAALNSVVARAVRTVFTQNVDVYTNLEGTQPVVVYVTGYVPNPGSYSGGATDSVLYFLGRAGGIDLRRGSFRDVTLMRGGKSLKRIDLYDFLLTGNIAKPQFNDGDTIVVGPRRDTVVVEGDARNAFEFEFSDDKLDGKALIALARPEPNVSHVSLVGVRDGSPISAYLPLSELVRMTLRAGDRVLFEADRRQESMLVRVEGSHLGLSRYSVPVDTRLKALLDHIAVDPKLADTAAISLRRESVARRQATAIEQSLRRLEAVMFSASSQTDEEAKIRAQEAKLISEFVARARQVKPQGVLVVARRGSIEDVLLQPGDVVSIPERAGTVLVSGEVLVPQALVHDKGASLASYIQRVGGYTDRADVDRFLVIRRNAEVVQGGAEVEIHEGDEIAVLPKVPVKSLQLAKSVVQILYQLALSTAIGLNI